MTPHIAKQPVKPPRLSMKMLHDLIVEQQQLNDQLMKRIEVLEAQLERTEPVANVIGEEALLAPVESQDEPSILLDDSLSAQERLPQAEQLPEEPMFKPAEASAELSMTAALSDDLPLDELIQATLNPAQAQIAVASETRISPVSYAPAPSEQDSWSCIETPRSMRHPSPAKKQRIWDRLWQWSGTRQSQNQAVTQRREAGHSGHPRLSLDLPHEPMRLRSSSE
ncbi:hypothetical protein [Paenibacillus daejeonensis]|uniref:hypothetical protein n=1 Tax=Paenibacillus daejeonensis TaxID=135193 RepID=UPI000377E6AC|nr:hypothetical protein [Paenibacillus daejeonensis]